MVLKTCSTKAVGILCNHHPRSFIYRYTAHSGNNNKTH